MRLNTEDFSIKHTVESAQPIMFFGDIKKDGNGIVYTSEGTMIDAEQSGSTLRCSSYGNLTESGLREEITRRFGLREDMKKIYREIGTDALIVEAINKYRGLRITRNDPWETTLCFVISQFNNVKRIKGIVSRLIAAYGKEKRFDAGNVEILFRDFPTPQAIARQSVKSLMSHGAGYRAEYIKAVAEACSGGFDLRKLEKKDYADAKEELMELRGIGDKVADCILLFGYGKLEAFPVDTWIKRVVEAAYFSGKTQSVRKIHEFADERWGGYAGYAQQYLFHFGRNSKKENVI
jgi:N-glycosylase/DNA lyase